MNNIVVELYPIDSVSLQIIPDSSPVLLELSQAIIIGYASVLDDAELVVDPVAYYILAKN